MKRFTRMEGAQAIVYSKGVYKQVDLYSRGEMVFAKVGSGFIRLLTHKTTSHPDTKWAEMDGAEDVGVRNGDVIPSGGANDE